MASAVPSSINNFGSAQAVRRYDPDALNGYGVRETNWQGSVSVSHQVRPGWGVMVGFFRTSFGNLLTTDNLPVVACGLHRILRHGAGGFAAPVGDERPQDLRLV